LREPTLFVKCGSAQILHPPWDSDRPAVITKKMLKLASNDGTGIRDKPTPRSGRNRSTAAMRPMVPACIRSSSENPLVRNGPATWRTSD
jgi:hypothetical protein